MVVVVVVAAAEPVKGFDCDDVDGNFMMFRFTIRLLVYLFLKKTCSHCLKCPHWFDLRIFSFKKNFFYNNNFYFVTFAVIGNTSNE